ncbi:MAG: alpha/beta fold hydrolase [Pseudomonadota bacterium]
MTVETYQPPLGLGNPHVQTILSSVGRRQIIPAPVQQFLQGGTTQIIQVSGVRLKVDLNLQTNPDSPLISFIPGWLGSSHSSYVVSMAHELFNAGFSVARINLRDHGDTAHLNPGLFNSALIEEVIALVEYLSNNFTNNSNNGLVGFSLGGNFALRVQKRLSILRCLAICPAIEPGDTMYQIDSSPIYQKYFVQKWRKTWAAKRAAFPDAFNFGSAMQLTTVSALTDYFVRYHSNYDSTTEYFAAYDLSGDYLADVNAQILASHDDPVIPSSQWADLPESINVDMTQQGGHGAYLDSWQLSSWADRYALEFFTQKN